MLDLSLNDWKQFLSARLQQEAGEDKAALEVFDELLSKYPNNSHLSASRAIALLRLGRQEEATAAMIASTYSVIGRSLVDENDTPEKWGTALRGAIKEIDDFKETGKLSAAIIAW